MQGGTFDTGLTESNSDPTSEGAREETRGGWTLNIRGWPFVALAGERIEGAGDAGGVEAGGRGGRLPPKAMQGSGSRTWFSSTW